MIRLDEHKDQAGAWVVLANASGEVAFDVGANIGQSTKVLAENFTKVVAFEPCLQSYEILNEEKASNVWAVPCAISDVNGQIELEEHENSIRTGQLTSGDGLHWGVRTGVRRVASKTLDYMVQVYGRPDFVKIDTEGHEVHVVRGGVHCLSDLTIGLIIEVHKAENEMMIRSLLPGRKFVKLEHELRLNSLIRQNHFWLVSNG